MEGRILTLHPQGKEGVNICARKYETIRDAILNSLSESKQLSFKELTKSVGELVAGHFEGSIAWYVTTVKLDMEAREMIQCSRGKGPQKISLT